MRRALLLGMLISVSLISCKEKLVSPEEKSDKVPLFPSVMGLSTGNLYAGFQASRQIQKRQEGTFRWDEVYAVFFNPDSVNGVWAGQVLMNNTSVLAHPYQHSSTGTYYQSTALDGGASPQSVLLSMNGSYHVFDVTGSSSVSPIHDSIQAPTAEINVTYPTVLTPISKSAGLTITWNGVGADTAYVVISDTVSAVSHQGFVKATSDNGSLSISSSDLVSLQPGPVRVSVARGNYKIATDVTGRDYMMVLYTEQVIFTTLTQ